MYEPIVMIEQELKNIWKSSSKDEQIKFEKSKLLLELQSNLDRFYKSLKFRDLREQIVAFLMIPLFSVIAYKIPFFLSKAGAVIIVIWCVYLIFKLQGLKKYKPAPATESFKTYLQKTKSYLTAQKNLVDSVFYWYILPSSTGVIFFFIGFDLEEWKLILFISMTVGLGVIIFILNKQAVKNEFLPRLTKIDEIIKNMN
jgi:hypothetical protein